jgi:hypothetical protein
VMLPCYEGSVWLILDMLCPLGTVAGQTFWQISARAKPKTNAVCLQPAHQGNHCWTISFPPYGSNEWCYHAKHCIRIIP